jgi:mitochondrial import inner membrane translocase subunit TIM23
MLFTHSHQRRWDSLTGRKSSPSTTSGGSVERHDNFGAPALEVPTAESVSEYLIDPAQLQPFANLSKDTLEYLALEDSVLSDLPGSRSALPSRGWSDDLCYGTGCTYLVALGMGGAWGMVEGLNRTPATAPPKIRLNAVLNSVTRRGPFLGNSAGVVAMVYNGINSYIGYVRGKRKESGPDRPRNGSLIRPLDDAANSIAAGALSGMIFKSTRGPRQMVISGGIVASVAGIWAVSVLSSRILNL